MIDKRKNKNPIDVAEIDGELVDAIIELELDEFIIEAGREYGRSLLGDTVLAYVEIGRTQQDDEEVLFTVAHTVGQDWIVIREIPGLHRTILGRFENAYGAIGIVRQHHPATDPLRGSTPTYPEWLIEKVNLELGAILKERELMECVVEVDTEAQEIVLSSNNRSPKVHLSSDTDSEWKASISHEYGFETLGAWENLDAAIDEVETKIQTGETQ
ncbi:hypothetical protein SAMN05444422_1066 [Halobiforma haloterrestris]|uniref:Uncharacterized protein n=1 Tax=Natronobacterium haloterrestre TaxID=148448 RepID=A0A1I1HIN8_NATHA|nr:hypothetical protein [Halobiforma haloterrestris]SFC23834.1 hypothetical protein SAMN05444422_1066 [Halobiforma haloterrestris]